MAAKDQPKTQRGRILAARTILKKGATIAAKNLVKHVNKELEMTATEIQAARIILSKVIPDLKAIEMRDEAPQDAVARLLEAVMDENQRSRANGKGNGAVH